MSSHVSKTSLLCATVPILSSCASHAKASSGTPSHTEKPNPHSSLKPLDGLADHYPPLPTPFLLPGLTTALQTLQECSGLRTFALYSVLPQKLFPRYWWVFLFSSPRSGHLHSEAFWSDMALTHSPITPTFPYFLSPLCSSPSNILSTLPLLHFLLTPTEVPPGISVFSSQMHPHLIEQVLDL